MFTKTFKSMSAAKQISFLAVFVALSVVANSFLGIDISPTNKITFTYFICFFAGFLFGPLPAILVGFLGDLIGFLIVPVGVYWLYGVSLGLYGFLAGLIMNFISGEGLGRQYAKATLALSVCFVLITCFLNSVVMYYYMYLFVWDNVFEKAFLVYLGGRLGFQSIIYAVNAGMCLLALPLFVRFRNFLR